jgi:hypothetical protein
MEENRQAVMDWWNSGADYDRGALLYSRIGKNRNMAALFLGKRLRYELKLRYELCKSAGIDWKNMPGVPPSFVPGSGIKSLVEPSALPVDQPVSGSAWINRDNSNLCINHA